jgi:hypothetical protein
MTKPSQPMLDQNFLNWYHPNSILNVFVSDSISVGHTHQQLLSGQASATTFSTLRVPPPARLVPKLGGYAPNYYSTTTRVISASSLARGLGTNNYPTWFLRLTWRRARGLNATRVLK